jgi:hypothetical protein
MLLRYVLSLYLTAHFQPEFICEIISYVSAAVQIIFGTQNFYRAEPCFKMFTTYFHVHNCRFL